MGWPFAVWGPFYGTTSTAALEGPIGVARAGRTICEGREAEALRSGKMRGEDGSRASVGDGRVPWACPAKAHWPDETGKSVFCLLLAGRTADLL